MLSAMGKQTRKLRWSIILNVKSVVQLKKIFAKVSRVTMYVLLSEILRLCLSVDVWNMLDELNKIRTSLIKQKIIKNNWRLYTDPRFDSFYMASQAYLESRPLKNK